MKFAARALLDLGLRGELIEARDEVDCMRRQIRADDALIGAALEQLGDVRAVSQVVDKASMRRAKGPDAEARATNAAALAPEAVARLPFGNGQFR